LWQTGGCTLPGVFKLILKITGGVFLLAVVAVVGVYLYTVFTITVMDAEPDQSLLDKAAISQPHYFGVTGAGKVRLTVSADWIADGWGHVWRYTTNIDYRHREADPWVRIGTQTSRREPLVYSDQHAIGNQVLITNLRAYKQTHLAHGFQEFYLWSENTGVKKHRLSLRNPRTLIFHPPYANQQWQRYEVRTRPESLDHEVAIWSQLVKHMSLEEICWYAFDAGAISYTYKPEQALLEVVHIVGQTRRLTFEFVEQGKLPELVTIERIEPKKEWGANYSPKQMRQLSTSGSLGMHYVEPMVFRDLQQQRHPCVDYYQAHNLVRAASEQGAGFLYPAY
jgi:hypothetical protein